MSTVTFYTRKGCHLCDEALAVIQQVRAIVAFELVVQDLDGEASPAKLAAYDHEVPVVELDGKKIMKFHVDPNRLTRLLTL